MTHPTVHTAAGEPLHRLVHRSAPMLARRIVPRLVEAVPFYALLPREELDGEIRGITEATVRLIAEVLRTGAQPAPAHLTRFAASAARRAQEGVPLEMILRAYHTGVSEVWRMLEPEIADRSDIGPVLGVVLDCLATVTGAIAAAYVAEREAMAGTDQGERHRVVAALLAGESAEQAALGAGLRLAERYEVVAVAFGDQAEDEEVSVSGAAKLTTDSLEPADTTAAAAIRAGIAHRRRIRRVTAELSRRTNGAALQLLDASGGMILVPDPPQWPSSSPGGLRATLSNAESRAPSLAELRAALATAARSSVTFAAVPAPPSDVTAAARTAREVLRIVQLIGRPPGVHRLEDVLLPYQLSRPIEANRRLAALLEPLAEHPELLETLRVHLGNELNRKRTASDLHVHPNTVDYRLRRISSLTALDVALPSAQRLLDAALTARLLLPPATATPA